MKENRFFHALHRIPAGLRLLISLAFAGIMYLLIRNSYPFSVQIMTTWISFALVNLIQLWLIFITVDAEEIKKIAKKQDSSRTLIFLIVIVAAFISLISIVLLLRILPNVGDKGYYYHIGLSIASVICSWFLIHTIFAIRYAHLFYSYKTGEAGSGNKQFGGLQFPDDDEPDYIDFSYFSFVIGMTFQVSDVQITSSHIRHLALLHGLLSFAYNTVILALSINIISGLIQK